MTSGNKRSLKRTRQHARAKRATAPMPVQAEATSELVRGNSHFQQGAYAEAASCYQRALVLEPRLIAAHNNLGIALLRQGRPSEAAASFASAISLKPSYAEALNNLGNALMALGKVEEAIDSYQRAIRSRSDYADAYSNLGTALTAANRTSDALRCLEQALELRPRFADAHSNLGHLLHSIGRTDDALCSFRAALAISPELLETRLSVAQCLRELGQLKEAENEYRHVLQHQPRADAAQVGLAEVLKDQQRWTEAVVAYQKALALRPGDAQMRVALAAIHRRCNQPQDAIQQLEFALATDPDSVAALNNLANVLVDQGQSESAVTLLKRALAHDDQVPEVHYNLGNALGDLNDLQGAVRCYQQAIHLRPDDLRAISNLGNLLRRQGDATGARRAFADGRRRNSSDPLWQLRWSSVCPAVYSQASDLDAYQEQLLATIARCRGALKQKTPDELVRAGIEAPFNLQFHSGNLRPLKEGYASLFRDCFPVREAPTSSHRHPQLGIVVTLNNERIFLRSLRGVLERLNRQLIDITIICNRAGEQTLRSGLSQANCRYLVMPEGVDATADAIADAQFDILYYWEIGTDALNYFLPFYRLAPVQCTSWGIQLTTGIPSVDFYLSSGFIEPGDARDHYTEQLLLADTLLTFQQPDQIQINATRRDFGFTETQHLYLCAQHPGKVHPQFDAVLRKILERDPQAIIVGTEDPYGFGAEELRRRFQRTIPDACDRIRLLPRQQRREYMNLLSLADVVLDPPHFGGVNTTYDALSLDLPLITFPSSFHRGRYTLGCYRKMGVDDCIASSWEDYIDRACRLACNSDARRMVRHRITDAKASLFEDPTAVREHERLLAQLLESARPFSGSAVLAASDKSLHTLLQDGLQLMQHGQLDAAISHFRHSLRTYPRSAEAHGLLGNAFKQQGRLADALACYRQVLQLDPGRGEAHNNLANTLMQQGHYTEAAAHYRQALASLAHLPEVHHNLGCALRNSGDLKAAVTAFEHATRLRPDYAAAHDALGTTWAQQGDCIQAITCYEKAISIDTTLTTCRLNLGHLQRQMGDTDGAHQQYLELGRRQPQDETLQLCLASLWPAVFSSRSEMDEHAEISKATCQRLTENEWRLPISELPISGCEPPLAMQFLHGNLRDLKSVHAATFKCSFADVPEILAPRNGRPQVGFVITDKHERAFLKSVGGVVERLNPQKFGIVIFGSARGVQKMRRFLRRDDLAFVELPFNLPRMIDTIQQQRLDLVYHWEIGSDAYNYFLPFAPLASKQCTSWGIQVTSGIPQVGYYLSSELIEPPNAQEHYTEQFVGAKTLLSWQERRKLPQPMKTRNDFGFSDQQRVYACAQHLGKFHPDFDPLLRDILEQDESGIVAITSDRWGFHVKRLRQRLARTLGQLAERVVYLPQLASDDYMHLLNVADVLLDPPHFGGVNSTYDAFSIGRAVVTLPSPFHRGRYTLGCYRKMGVGDCIAYSAEHYAKLAVRLACERDFRYTVEKKIREASHMLFEDRESVSEHERLFEKICHG